MHLTNCDSCNIVISVGTIPRVKGETFCEKCYNDINEAEEFLKEQEELLNDMYKD